ncbi:MAG: DinB family protein [Deltaproteobacteria bacterium]|nr:DinB family protein [Deltaproteobacteria bacterium]
MDETIPVIIVSRIQMAHSWILKATEELTEEELCRSFEASSPPVGWHLWHIARWADRLQASLPRKAGPPLPQPNPSQSLWEAENLAVRWGLDPRTLGTFEEGSGMSFDAAAALPRRIGRDSLLDYARRVFTMANAAVAGLVPEDLPQARKGIMGYEVVDGQIRPIPEKKTTIAAELIFHISHASRHLGMIEALRGLLGRKGTATA